MQINLINIKDMKKSKFNPAFVVDLTNDINITDIIDAFNDAKAKAGKAVYNPSPVPTIVVVTIDTEVKEQLPWYKRFWNWITRKK